MFDNSFIDSLPDDPAIAGKRICDSFHDFHDSLLKQDLVSNYENYLSALAVLQAYSESHGIELEYPSLTGNIEINISRITDFFSNVSGTFDQKFTFSIFEKYKRSFERKFGKGFLYQFSDGDLKRIQTLINELREIISKTEALDEDHRSRLLKRLEKLQSELHKTVSDLDRFWGLLIEGSVVFKKIGENAKPIVDRIQEIANIVWRVQARAEELPSNIPLELPSGEEEE